MTTRVWLRIALVAATVACAWLTSYRLRVSTDVSALLPASGDAAALAAWTRAFGGGDPALVLVRGERPDDVASATGALVEALGHAPSIVRVIDRVPRPASPGDPTLAWAYAGPRARERLATMVTPEGMRARLQQTRELLLAPAVDDDLEQWLARIHSGSRRSRGKDARRRCCPAWATHPGVCSSRTGDVRGWWPSSRAVARSSRPRRARSCRTSSARSGTRLVPG